MVHCVFHTNTIGGGEGGHHVVEALNIHCNVTKRMTILPIMMSHVQY